jgi:membrane-associated protease RseP (regulator of RpoE activity)
MLAGILIFVGGVFVMIFVHELGHFLTAKRFGIKVQEFFIGFGPRLWSFRKGETEYGIKAIPVGGYVKIAGMNPMEEPVPEDRDRLFTSKPRWQRAIVLAAGAFTHFVLAFLLLAFVFGVVGVATRLGGPAQINGVEAELDGRPSPAAAAGLQAGDEVVAVDGSPVDIDEFSEYVDGHVGEEIEIVVEREGQRVRVRATPVLATVEGQETGRLGVIIQPTEVLERDRSGPIETVTRSGRAIGQLTVASFRAMGTVFGPEGLGAIWSALTGEEQRTVNDPIGVVGAARISGQAIEAGQMEFFFSLFAFFNVFVGILNILPLPPLDGGHLAVLGFEAATGRRVDPRRLAPITALVAGFLILLTISLVYLDVVAPIPNPFQ